MQIRLPIVRPTVHQSLQGGILCLALVFLASCTPSPAANVTRYLVQKWLADQTASLPYIPPPQPTGSLTGQLLFGGEPIPAMTVVVAQPDGTPHSQVTDAQGRYRIDGLPPGNYVPAAAGPGFEETALTDRLGLPWLIPVRSGEIAVAPPFHLMRHSPPPLPENLAPAVQLTPGATYTVTSLFPPGAAAQVQRFQFTRAGAVNDSLRLYLPLESQPGDQWPLLLAVFPGIIDGWESVSVAFASEGFALVAISPLSDWGMDIDQHTLDARVALELALQGQLTDHIAPGPVVALGGSFSSAILHRLLRDEGSRFGGWVTVGGISNAFQGTADFYAGRLELPPQYALAIPALGQPNLYPLPFLRYSPVYTAGELPATLIIHTDADRIIPISQAMELEQMLRTNRVPVEVFYYADTSHYLHIGAEMSDAGRQMYFLIRDFARAHAGPHP